LAPGKAIIDAKLGKFETMIRSLPFYDMFQENILGSCDLKAGLKEETLKQTLAAIDTTPFSFDELGSLANDIAKVALPLFFLNNQRAKKNCLNALAVKVSRSQLVPELARAICAKALLQEIEQLEPEQASKTVADATCKLLDGPTDKFKKLCQASRSLSMLSDALQTSWWKTETHIKLVEKWNLQAKDPSVAYRRHLLGPPISFQQ